MDETKHALVRKLAEACNAVGGVEKKGKNIEQKYDYVRAADVAKSIRHELFKRGVVVLPDEQEPTWKEFQTRSGGVMQECHLTVNFRILDEGGEEIQVKGIGVARDSGDKAIYKAKTGALKYFLRGLGLIPDEKDDPEADGTVDAKSNRHVLLQKRFKAMADKVTPQAGGATKVKLASGELLWVRDLNLDKMLSTAEGKEIEVDCQECIGTQGKHFWEVQGVIRVGAYDFSAGQQEDLTPVSPEIEETCISPNVDFKRK